MADSDNGSPADSADDSMLNVTQNCSGQTYYVIIYCIHRCASSEGNWYLQTRAL